MELSKCANKKDRATYICLSVGKMVITGFSRSSGLVLKHAKKIFKLFDVKIYHKLEAEIAMKQEILQKQDQIY